VERRRYNETVQDYNTYIALFPNSIVAGMSGFARNDAYFSATPESREVPRVQFPGATAQPAPAPAR
jgi:LemA protein